MDPMRERERAIVRAVASGRVPHYTPPGDDWCDGVIATVDEKHPRDLRAVRRDIIAEVFRYFASLMPDALGLKIAKVSLLSREVMPPDMDRIEKEAIVRSTTEYLRSNYTTPEEYGEIVKIILDEAPDVIERIKSELTQGK